MTPYTELTVKIGPEQYKMFGAATLAQSLKIRGGGYRVYKEDQLRALLHDPGMVFALNDTLGKPRYRLLLDMVEYTDFGGFTDYAPRGDEMTMTVHHRTGEETWLHKETP